MERKVHLVNKRPPKPKMLRVVGYARGSSGKDAMLHSLASQIDYFQNLIKNHAVMPRVAYRYALEKFDKDTRKKLMEL